MSRAFRVLLVCSGLTLVFGIFWVHHGSLPFSEKRLAAQGGPISGDEGALEAPALQIIEYQVQPGDTLETIAQEFGVSVEALVGSNANALDDLHALELGTVLKIVKNGVLHSVKRGQTLTDIARTYGISLTEILWANRLEDREYIYPGEEFFIPGARTSPVFTYLQMAGGKKSLFAWPVRGVLTSGFGPRIHPISGEPDFHQGIDIEVPEGTNIYASCAGRVIVAGRHSGYGLYIVLEHSNGYRTLYGHLSEIGVYRGQFVEGGQVIGRSGNTGNSTGPHLHFEMLQYGRPLNPLALLPP
ncbi:MAG: peptidoglycan DD-metalloendopeptidase family protein [Candidatus Bipolaricaulia bacterium]